jgi:hypothetical protein
MSTKHEGIAFVLMRGVMEGDGFNYRTIPRDCLNVGRPWKAPDSESGYKLFSHPKLDRCIVTTYYRA